MSFLNSFARASYNNSEVCGPVLSGWFQKLFILHLLAIMKSRKLMLVKRSLNLFFSYQNCTFLLNLFFFVNSRTPYTQEQVNIGSGPPGSKVRWFRSTSDESRFINTVTFDSKEDSPILVMIHGYGASQGFFFRNFDALAKHFRVIAIDQLGWAYFLFIFCMLFKL